MSVNPALLPRHACLLTEHRLLLHGVQKVDPRACFLDLLGRRAEIIAPSHPGFGHSARPPDFDTVDDLVHLYLDVLEALPYERVTLAGLSFGGWLAAEIAVKCCHRIDRFVLVDAFGIKISDRETPDILEVFNTAPQEAQRRSWHDHQALQGGAAPAAGDRARHRGLTTLFEAHRHRHLRDDRESPGRRARERRGAPLTRVAAPTMISAVRYAEEIAQDPRTATVRHPRGETA